MDIEPSLHDYWRILQKRKWVVLVILSLSCIGTAVYTSLRTPLYRAVAAVKYEPPSGKTIGMDNSNFDSYSAIKTQIRLLSSGDMSAKVAKRVGGKHKASFRPEAVPDSNLINISATSADPAAAADLANAVAELYMERDIQERSYYTNKSLEDITARRQEVEAGLRKLEESRQAYLEEHQGAGMSGSLTSTLLDQEGRRKDLLKKFTTEHPDVVALDQRIQSTRARLAQIPAQDLELERMNRDIKVNEELYVTLSRQLEETRVVLSATPSFVNIVSRASVPEAPFYPNKRTNNMLGSLMGLLAGLIAAFLLESLDISISTIEEIEKVVGVPVLGVVPHLGTEKRWDAMKAKLLRKQRYPTDVFRSLLLFHQSAKSPIIEVYHSLRSNVQSQRPDLEGMVLTFTSTGVAEGKTLTATNFCLAAAHVGLRTLLIGSDIRRPVVHRVFGLPKQPGLMEVLAGKNEWREVIRGTVDFLMGEIDLDKLLTFSGIDNFKVMTSWTASSADIVNVFSSNRLPDFIKEVRPHFDLIVFDCPPVLLFVDAALIGAQTDGVVMVYQAGKMARQALRRAKDQLISSKANILGVILNDMQASEMGPGYAYYYGYGHYAEEQK